MRATSAVAVAAGIASLLGIASCSRRSAANAKLVPAGSTVVALGDSITHGSGAEPSAAYPVQLAALSGWNVVNGGVPGDTAEQALERLPALLDEHQPALVIVSIGGNDFLRRLPTDTTRQAIHRTLERCKQAGAQVVLVAVPQLSLTAVVGAGLSDHPMYEAIASDAKVPLHAGGWSQVLGDAALKSDAIHANAAGYRAFAEGLARTLRKDGLLG
jgi:acyl-CoA thioesterase I